MSPKYTLAVTTRILIHCGQSAAAEKLAEIRDSFLREVGIIAACNKEGSAKTNKISFGDAKLKELLKELGPKEADKTEKKEWQAFAATFSAAWALAVATDGDVPLTAADIEARAADIEARKAKSEAAPK